MASKFSGKKEQKLKCMLAMSNETETKCQVQLSPNDIDLDTSGTTAWDTG